VPYAYQTVRIGPLQDFIQEWASPDFHSLQVQPFAWLLLLTLTAMGLSRRRADWVDLILVVGFGYMALLAVRHIALFALVVVPILSRHTILILDELARSPRFSWLKIVSRQPERGALRPAVRSLNAAILVLLTLAASVKVGAELLRLQDSEVWGQNLPLAAVDFLSKRQLPGQMFNSYNWGGYLIWTLYPEKPVFVDGRTDLYAFNGQVLEDYVRVQFTQPGWHGVLEAYHIGYALIERDSLLALALEEADGWAKVHMDELAVVFVRRSSAP
jgi:hypothetical protein